MINNKQPTPTHGQVARSSSPGAFGVSTGSAMSITPKEMLDILRRHLFLIISLTIMGTVVGVGLWFILKTIAPKYTARTYIEVLSPGQSDPTIIGTPLASKDIAYEFRSSKAALIKQQSTLQELIRRDTIRETKWFKKFGNDIIKIIEGLEDHLGVFPDRNSSYISISMTCGDPEEAAIIVNQMVDLFVKSQQTTAEAGIGQKLGELNQQENELRDKLRSLTNSLSDIRRSTGLTQLEGAANEGTFHHTITQKLASLEIEKMKLEADIEQVRANVASYEERKISDEIVQRDTENDPVVIGLIQRIASSGNRTCKKAYKPW